MDSHDILHKGILLKYVKTLQFRSIMDNTMDTLHEDQCAFLCTLKAQQLACNLLNI